MVVVFSSSSGSSRGRSSSGSSRYCSRGSSDLVTVGHKCHILLVLKLIFNN